MSDEATPEASAEKDVAAQCGWVKLYHKAGVLVTLPVPYGHPAEMFSSVTAYLDSGFLAQMPGTEPGEMVEEVGWVVRGTKRGRDGIDDVITLYSTNESWTKPFLAMYLNNDKDRANFEFASGLKTASIPEYVGEGRLERGKNPSADKLIIKAPRPFKVVMKPNPKWSQAEYDAAKASPSSKPYIVPKKVFVRWIDQRPQEHQEQAKQDAKPELELTTVEMNEVEKLKSELATNPNLPKFNAILAKYIDLPGGSLRKTVMPMLKAYAASNNYKYDARAGNYYQEIPTSTDESIPW